MMTCFYETGFIMQSILLVLCQFAMIVYAGATVLLFVCRCRLIKLLTVCALLAGSIFLYVMLQLDSRGENPQGVHLHLPYAVLVLMLMAAICFVAWAVLSETKNRRVINNSSIKEALDTLPTGVCFFNEAGLPVLCNPAMHRFSFAVGGRDVQYVTDLSYCLDDDYIPAGDTEKDGNLFIFGDSSAWLLEKRPFCYHDGSVYTQFIATDVTELCNSYNELRAENEQLGRVQENLKRLSANVVAATREEEILNAKMRVHDEMGRCLVEARKYLRPDSTESIPDSIAASWQRAVSMLKYDNDSREEDMQLQIRKTCESIGVNFVQSGSLPDEDAVAYILTCAVRECLTNAVRYAGADEIYAEFTETDDTAGVSVTNSGRPPEKEITEGGGLSTLRRRVERMGGSMQITSLPRFRLTVTVPKGKEGAL